MIYDGLTTEELVAEIQLLEAENERLREEQIAFAVELGFGDGVTEPAATLSDMVEPIKQAFSEAHDHFECPAICELCGENLASQTCDKCYGSGCLPNSALAYLECDECAGVGKVHPGCVEKSYTDLASEVEELTSRLETTSQVWYS